MQDQSQKQATRQPYDVKPQPAVVVEEQTREGGVIVERADRVAGNAGTKMGDDERIRKTVDMLTVTSPGHRETVTGTVDLPGGGMATIKPAGSNEERIITNLALQENGTAGDEWLAACVLNLRGKSPVKADDVVAMLYGDRIYLAVRIVYLTYGDEIEFDVACPRCGEENALGISLTETVFKTLKPYPAEREFDVTLPSGRVARYGFRTGLHSRMKRDSDDRSLLDEMMMRLKALDGVSASAKSWDQLDGRDRAALRSELIRNQGGGVDTLVTNTCKGCRRKFTTLLEENLNFFLPGLRRS